ncbi:MAG: DUF3108 domain-containing protein [Methyloceanibacter sp.]|nr:DUF3108 domain-containing protein [Methyloceanibacter sp.]
MRFGSLGVWTALAGVGVICLALANADVAESKGNAEDIRASYRVGVGAIDLGTFDLTGVVDRKTYTLKAKGDFSILAGLVYRATGTTNSNGRRLDAVARPQRFDFSYTDNRKKQAMQIVFKNKAAPVVTRTPKKRPDKKAVPLSEGQLRNVLDPLTAAFLSVHGNFPAGDTAVCNQTLRVFDGKRLFELTLSPKRTEKLGKRAPGGLRAAAVCAVRYQPIGGHRPESRTVAYLQKSKDIEAWLVPVSGTDMFVPYKVVVPTAWGQGTARLTKLKTQASAGRRASAR